MGYVLKETVCNQVEVRELEHLEYFEWDDSVYQKLRVGAIFNVKTSQYEPHPVYVVCLSSGLITYFSSDGKTVVTRLYETSPLVLSRQKP